MNSAQFKQWIHGIFFDDANSRERNFHDLEIRHMLFQGGNYPQVVETDNVMRVLGLLTTPDLSRVWGTDISHWDGNVDLQTTRNKGATFVFIKGLDGTLQVANYPTNKARAQAVGLAHAPYQWLYRNVNVSCVAQARAMKALMDKYPCNMPPVIDWEWTYWGGVQSNPNLSDLEIYVTELNRLGIKPILYTAAGYANQFAAMPAGLKIMFSGFWFANYGVSTPALPKGFTSWDFWQFTSSGDASVYSPNSVGKKEVDLNYFNGTKAQFAARYGFPSSPPPDLPPNGDNMIYVNKVTTSALNGRSTPDASISNVVISFVQNDLLICDQQKTAGGASWRRVRACIRNGANVPLPAGEIWASDGSAGTLQGELASFDAGFDVNAISVFKSESMSFVVDGQIVRTIGNDNVELK